MLGMCRTYVAPTRRAHCRAPQAVAAHPCAVQCVLSSQTTTFSVPLLLLLSAALTRNQLDAAKFAEEAERWERVRLGPGLGMVCQERGGVHWRAACSGCDAVQVFARLPHQAAPQPLPTHRQRHLVSPLRACHVLQAAKDLTLLGPPTEEPDRKRRRVDAMLSKKLALTVQVGLGRRQQVFRGPGGAGCGWGAGQGRGLWNRKRAGWAGQRSVLHHCARHLAPLCPCKQLVPFPPALP